jgi:secondary thiamine-phosphate synthase enzyme
MACMQKEFSLQPRRRGFHLVTSEILAACPELAPVKAGLLHLFIKHTSASLTINENADPTVRSDFERHLSIMVPDGASHFEHDLEGADDMPAHIKSSLLGAGITIPITNGRLNLGTWQGIYLCEHRNHGGRREIVVTIIYD